ncbi:MAG: hydroxymethylglutaryl-CoA synthase [Nitrososphaerota archaeon]|nr:3-hydroxy-3-methylglutaryl-CoA synthase [Candidatus Bathyarchaeota archaeon]MDW8048412.1 hydroxymethylglutaryl-CoA synthase [Nitrososphaerota archaeon]
MKRVGIDDIAAYVPKIYLDTEEMAKARGIDPNKITKGLGIEKLAIPDAHEDAATMAAMATLDLMVKNDLKPRDIDFIHVATESGPDAAKPISCYVQGMLEQIYGKGSFDHIGAPETKFACVGATYAIIDRLAYIASGWNRAKYSIVVATDIAKYELNSSGEPTQGAAAVALLLKDDPRLLVYEPKFTGFGTVDDKDFFRPVERTTAVVNGQYSIGCYLRDMRIAADAYKRNMVRYGVLRSMNDPVIEKIDLISFHSPFPKMVQYAFATFLIHDLRNAPVWRDIISRIGSEPSREGMTDVEYYISDAHKEFRKRFSATEEFTKAYEEKVANSLVALSQIGNSYTASVWLGVASHFELSKSDLEGKRLGIGSYGSGSSAIVCSFIVQSEYKDVTKKIGLMEQLDKRQKITMEVYEDLHEGRLGYGDSVIPPREEFALVDLGRSETDYGYRYYKFIK